MPDAAPRFDLPEGTAVLARTPAVLDALLAGLPEPWTEADEGPGTWSPRVVVGHLIHGEETDWIPRARIILEEGEARPFTPYDRLAQFDRFGTHPIGELLALFAQRRKESLAVLEGWRLTPERLALTGTHPELGRVTLRQLLATWVAHDLGHLAQVVRAMAKRYAADVGPWAAYLSIFGR